MGLADWFWHNAKREIDNDNNDNDTNTNTNTTTTNNNVYYQYFCHTN